MIISIPTPRHVNITIGTQMGLTFSDFGVGGV
jgi:hypothetical protein